jgi:hypothetical protein
MIATRSRQLVFLTMPRHAARRQKVGVLILCRDLPHNAGVVGSSPTPAIPQTDVDGSVSDLVALARESCVTMAATTERPEGRT